MDRFQVTPRGTEFWIDAGKSATVTNIGSSTVYGSPDTPPTSIATAAWSLAPGASRVEDVGAVWVLTAAGTSSTLTVDPIASGLATDTGTGQPSAIGSGGSGSGLPSAILTKTTTYAAVSGDFIQANAASAGFTITLPSNPAAGTLVAVKKVDSSSNIVTIAPTGAGSIDGQSTATTSTQWAGAIFEHVGSDVWRISASMSTTGPAGTNGNTVLTTSGAPSNGTGQNGDYAYDPATKIIYGPKAGGAWPAGVVLGGSSGGAITFYGDGSDGSFVADGAATMPGASLSGGVYNLSRNVYLSGLTVNSGVRIFTNGYILNVKGLLTNNGAIDCNGRLGGAGAGTATGSNAGAEGSGVGNTAGSGGATGNQVGYGRAGGLANGTAGSASPQSLGGSGGAGGSASAGANAGGAGGSASLINADSASRMAQFATAGYLISLNSGLQQYYGGGGGGGAGNDGTVQGGGGGGGGGVCIINAVTIVNNNVLQARGARGADAVGGNSGGGGGGGGGVLFINTTAYSGSGTYDANGGAGGAKGGTGVAGSAGTAGTSRLNIWA